MCRSDNGQDEIIIQHNTIYFLFQLRHTKYYDTSCENHWRKDSDGGDFCIYILVLRKRVRF